MTERHKVLLQHFSHHHQLELFYLQAYFGNQFHCEGCGEGVFGFIYYCTVGCFFYLHKSCAKQPQDLQQYPLHPQHPLILTTTIPHPLERCYFCNQYILKGFAYNCSHCNFNLHFKCTSIPFTVKPEFHDHPLNLLRKAVSFTCDACGKEDKDMSYLCLRCPLMVHLKCATLPLTLKHVSHHHALNLTESSQLDQSHRPICRICVKKVETDRVYYCSKCNFVAHLHCATREEYTEEIKQPLESTGILEDEDSELEGSSDSLAYVVKKIKTGEDKIEIAEEIKHFSHEHDLKLTEEELQSDEKCDGCMHPIFPHPFYSCTKCRFFLHKSCVELPKTKRHPLHPHPLTLLAKAIGFYCQVCGLMDHYDRFTYYCEQCNFHTDVQCGLISDILIHDGHKHQLILSRTPYEEKCSCCDKEGRVLFKCADCEFILDVRSATLPHSVRYRHFEQPFKLCYNVEDDSDDENYCDICEEARNPIHWFYYCAYLNLFAHPNCILGNFTCII
jgi:hypothetical protein